MQSHQAKAQKVNPWHLFPVTATENDTLIKKKTIFGKQVSMSFSIKMDQGYMQALLKRSCQISIG